MHLHERMFVALLLLTALLGLVNASFYLGPLGKLLRRLTEESVLARPESSAATAGPQERPLPSVSVVMAARNEGPRLRKNLPQLLAQRYPAQLDIVVTDDASEDDSLDVLAHLAERSVAMPESLPRLHVVFESAKTHAGKKAALARSIVEARQDWLLATDADCWPAGRHWVETMMASAAQRSEIELVLGYAPYGKTQGLLNGWIRFEAAYTAMQYVSAALHGRAYMGVGRNLLYHRRLYNRVDGFRAHAHLTSGDDDLLVNAGARPGNVEVCIEPQAWMYSDAAKSWRAYVRQKRRHLSVSSAYRAKDQQWLALLALSHGGFYLGLLGLWGGGGGWWVGGLYVVRALMVAPQCLRAMAGLWVAELRKFWPLLDFGVAVYYGFAALALAGPKAGGWRAGR